jgi:phage terminase large subunit-like protein
MPSDPSDRTVAVTAIEHGNIVITVASLVREPLSSPSSPTSPAFVTMILGGPLAGQTWEGMTWSTMVRNHAGAVSRIAELVAEQAGQSDELH